MKFTWSWLNDFIIPKGTPQDLAQRLTESGTETQVSDLYAGLAEFEIGQIKSITPHPNAHSLNLCTVNTSKGSVTVVCGASNLRLGMWGVLMRPGQYLPGDNIPLAPTTIRGIESPGMLCSEKELNLEGIFYSSSSEGILEIPENSPIKDTLYPLLPKDWLFDSEVTTNRGDLMSVFGIARELVALEVAQWRDPIWPNPLCQAVSLDTVSVPEIHITTSLCLQFHMARVQQDPQRPYRAPAWVNRRLRDIHKSLSQDVVNGLTYYTHSFGTPFHVFDAQTLSPPLVLECLSTETSFLALTQGETPGEPIHLSPGMLVLKDQKNVLTLSGILGGETSKYQPSSTTLYIEAAEFDAKTISLAGQKLRLMTSARRVFERGIDGRNLKEHLIQALKWMGFSQINLYTARSPNPNVQREISLSVNYFVKFTGCTVLTAREMSRRLTCLGFEVRTALEPTESGEHNEILTVTPPPWRKDIEGAPDLIEEILRFKGWYQEVPFTAPLLSCIPPLSLLQMHIQQGRTYLMHQGLGEAVTWSFISAHKAKEFSDIDSSSLKEMTLINPISQDMAVMRPSILPNLVDLALWHAHKHLQVQGRFEGGPVFFTGHPKGQKTVMSGVLPERLPPAWGRQDYFSFFHLKQLVNGLCMLWGEAPRYIEAQLPWMHPGQCAHIWIKDVCIGFMGKIHPRLTEEYPLMAFEVDPAQYPLPFAPKLSISPLQPIEKDLSFFLDKGSIGDFLYAFKQQDSELIEVCLVDCFKKEGRTSISIRCTFQPQHRSWSGEEIHHRLELLVGWAYKNGASLRGNALFSHLLS
ncbi:phenylalanine--tRNA ligase subunit beta [Holospora curviuscula]|uniref:phenylalanine--tRNA ligase n=1 Tax=Holospora curviuscula TaxID=1082868 RepID=A0A2S5R8Z8_9PROT|nr:phenylalanine--tRNA ligase subunit beta [Holospora curviuscula]PPE03763.1 Phenylalanine--tRNA ligase beta subunit [Holospora curviuscula]